MTITVNGGDPTDPDKLIVNSLATGGPEGLVVTPTAQGVGTVDSTLAGLPTVNYNTIEELTLVGQGGDGDVFGVDGTTGDDVLRYFSGDAADNGRVTGTMDGGDFTTPDLRFTGMGTTSTARFNNFGNQGGNDTFVYHGTEAIDNVVITAGLLVNTQGGSTFSNIETGTPSSASAAGTTSTVVVRTFGGHDTVTVTPEADVTVSLEGGQPDDGSDVLNFIGTGAGAVTLDLTAKTITEAGLGPVAFTGFETVNIDANNTLTVDGTASSETINVTPVNADNDGSFDHSGSAGIGFNYTDATAVTFNGGGGNDLLNVVGNVGDNVVTADGATVDVDGSVITLGTSIEAVGLTTLGGSDTIDITLVVGGTLSYDVLGGNPIGAVGDTLKITSPTSVTFMAGPEADSGALVDGGGAIISYDEIEDVGVMIAPAGPVVVMGSGADDDITAVGVGANSAIVTVNDGPPILYIGVTTLTLQGKEGDDDITIDVNNAFDVEFVVDGGPPTAGSDDLRVTGADGGNDNPVWTPDAVDGGDLTLDSLAVAIDVSFIENLFYDGESDDEGLTVVAFEPGNEPYTYHRPGPATDSGFLGLRDTIGGATIELLGVSYENLGSGGSVTADSSASDTATLAVLGTEDDDQVVIGFDADNSIVLSLTTAYGAHIPVQSIGVENYVVQTLGGNDDITLNSALRAESLDVFAGGPGDSDIMTFNGVNGVDDTYEVFPDMNSGDGIVEVNAVAGGYTGLEHLVFLGDANDDLNVNDDGGDNNWLLDAGPSGDRIQVDDRESVDYDGFATVDLTNTSDTDSFNIHPTNLTGFGNTLTVHGDAGNSDDVITFVATEDADIVTSGTDTVTINGVTVTVGNTNFAELRVVTLGGNDNVDLDLDLSGVNKVVELGAGDDNFDGSGMLDLDIYGGIGNDVIVGTPMPDRIFGGPGNDILIGGGGVDFTYGEAGDDIFGNPGLAADGVPDDPGADYNFGGDGVDSFVWEPGDGTDHNSGGDDGGDVLFFNGNAAANVIDLRSGSDPTQLDAIFNGAIIQNNGIENVFVIPMGGDDTINVDDLFLTEAASINIAAGGGNETITVDGRTVHDNLSVTTPAAGTVGIEGLTYDIDVINAATADSLTISTFEGDDSVAVDEGVEALITSTLNGGDGDDALSGAFNTANGDAGDDTIIGGSNDQTINGGAGEDTMVGGAGNDTFNGGTAFDTILIEGTLGADTIDVFQALPTQLNHTVNGDAQIDTLVASTVEQALVVAGDGADLIRVNWQDAHGVNAAVDSLRMTVAGGSDATSDRLIVVDDGTDDLVLYRKGQDNDSGTVEVGPGNAEPLLNVFSDIENIDFVDENGNSIDNGAAGSQLVVFKHDPFESNDDRFTATYLGSGDTINVDPTIDPGPLANPFGDGQDLDGDSDFYRVVAETTGTLDFQVYFRQVPDLASGRPGLPNDGNLDINVRDAAGNIIAGFGVNDADDDERVRIPVVEGQTYFLEVFGNNGDAINIYNFTVVNHAPPVPYALELLDNPPDGTTNPLGTSDNSDTGRSQFDNHTYDNTPTLFFRLDDGIFLHDLPGNPAPDTPPDEVIGIPFRAGVAQPNAPGFAIAIFDEGNTLPQTGTAPQTPLGFATATLQDGVYTFTVPNVVALSEGSHFLSARVQMIDPANPLQTGFGARSNVFEIVVDRTPPPVVFGLATAANDGLHPDSDSGDPVLPITLVDRVTNDETPTFFGRAEANSIIRLYVDLDFSNSLTADDLLIGQTVAVPLDGTEQLETPANPLEPGGQWEIISTVNMNDPRILTQIGISKDGLRTILLSAEDLAGNITDPNANEILEIFVDTQGPQVTDVFITGIPTSEFNLFTLKPDTPRPTPRVDSLTISIRDLPNRVAQFLYGAVSNGPPAPLDPIVLVGDHSGVIPIAGLRLDRDPFAPGIPATDHLVLTFDEPLPDDRFTLTLNDNLIDPVGNQLDGESNAAEPIGVPDFQMPGRTSGDGIPGGSFIARFTVDSRPEVATWSQGAVYADINGNFVWDPEGEDNDYTNRDFAYNFGEITDAYFVGNFATGANSSGFDKLGAYGRFNGDYQFFLDTDDDGIGDLVPSMAFQINAIPVAGNFSGPAGNAVPAGERPRDEIGAYDGQNWYLDVNGDNQIAGNEKFPTTLRGVPFVGDFNGDGFDDLATFNNNTGEFEFDLNRDGNINDTITFGFPGFGEKPVAGDFNLDGIDDIGLWVPGQEGQLPKDSGEFHFLLSDHDPIGNPTANPVIGTGPSVIFDPFSPAPLGNDLISQFGDDFALPLFGNFDPPISNDNSGAAFLGSLSNELNPLDTNLDGIVSSLDALVVINAIGRGLSQFSQPLRVVASLDGYLLDASQDGVISTGDALLVINELGRRAGGDPESTAEAEQTSWADSVAAAIAELDDDDDEDDLLQLLAADDYRHQF